MIYLRDTSAISASMRASQRRAAVGRERSSFAETALTVGAAVVSTERDASSVDGLPVVLRGVSVSSSRWTQRAERE